MFPGSDSELNLPNVHRLARCAENWLAATQHGLVRRRLKTLNASLQLGKCLFQFPDAAVKLDVREL